MIAWKSITTVYPMTKKSISIVLLLAALVLVEFSSLAHPVERTLLGASGWVRQTTRAVLPTEEFFASAQRATDTVLSRENEELKKQLAFRERTHTQSIGARVSGYSLDPLHSQLILDRGSQDGIRVGNPVVAGNGLLIGLIKTVDRDESMVIPLSDPRTKVLGIIPRDSGQVFGIVQGRFNVGVEMSLIPITDEVHTGDIVVTSGLQKGVPSGLVVGTIQEIQKKPADLFQTAILQALYERPPLDVSVITSLSQ